MQRMENAQVKMSESAEDTRRATEQPEVGSVCAKELMEKLRSEILRAVEEGRGTVSKFYPLKPKENLSDYPPLSSSEDLRDANLAYEELFKIPQFQSHRPVIGKFISKIKQKTYNLIWGSLLGEYLERERRIIEKLLRYANFSSQTIDHKFGSLFWELIGKLDIDLQAANDRTDRLISEIDGTFRTFERMVSASIGDSQAKVGALESSLFALKAQVKTVDNVARGLERTLALLSRSGLEEKGTAALATGGTGETALPDIEYLLLENRFRGSEEEITESVKSYVPLLSKLPGPVLDIGCGRGELLEALRQAGIEAFGVDMDRSMVERCREKGLRVEEADLFVDLESREPNSLGGIVATQVVEHLTQKQLDLFLQLSMKCLKSGGVFILETINPQSVTALARNFFRDPTHTFPVHPETLRFALEMKGFQTVDIDYRSPYPAEATLELIQYSAELPGRWISLLQRLNDNFTRLNSLLFGHQDYAVISRKG